MKIKRLINIKNNNMAKPIITNIAKLLKKSPKVRSTKVIKSIEMPKMKVVGTAELPAIKMSTTPDHLEALKQYPDEWWDALYKEALESGNMEYAKRLVDLHARVKAPEGAIIEPGYLVKRHPTPDIQPDPRGSVTVLPPHGVPETHIAVARDKEVAESWRDRSSSE
jgi:hypothetical protein